MVASVSPSAITYESPAAAGDGLGDGLGDGDGGGGLVVGLLSAGDGLAGGWISPVAVGVGGLPPTQPQAMLRTVPTIRAWTSQRGLRSSAAHRDFRRSEAHRDFRSSEAHREFRRADDHCMI